MNQIQTLDDALKNPTVIDVEKLRESIAVNFSFFYLNLSQMDKPSGLGDFETFASNHIPIEVLSLSLQELNILDDNFYYSFIQSFENLFDMDKLYFSSFNNLPKKVNSFEFVRSVQGKHLQYNNFWINEKKFIVYDNFKCDKIVGYNFVTSGDGIAFIINQYNKSKSNSNQRTLENSFLFMNQDFKDALFFDYIAKINPDSFRKGFKEYKRKKNYNDIFELDDLYHLKDNLPNSYLLSNPETVVGIMNHLLKQHGELKYKGDVLQDSTFKNEMRVIKNENGIDQIYIGETAVTLGEGIVQNHYYPISIGSDGIDAMLITSDAKKKIEYEGKIHLTPFTETFIIAPVDVYNKLFGNIETTKK